MSTYPIRDIPPDLHKALKNMAAYFDVTRREYILNAIVEKIQKDAELIEKRRRKAGIEEIEDEQYPSRD